METIKKFEPLSVMKIAAVTYGALGVLEGALFSVVFTMGFFADQSRQMSRFFSLLFGGLSIIFSPIFFAIIGAVFGGLGAVIYNVSARFVGGIQVEVE
jgi:hypothetical protein